MEEYTLYVPSDQNHWHIAPGSAIVGTAWCMGDRIMVDYEGDIYGWHKSFEDKLLRAIYRHQAKYPTIARSALEPSDLIAVGMVLVDDYQIRAISIFPEHEQLFEEWKAKTKTPADDIA